VAGWRGGGPRCRTPVRPGKRMETWEKNEGVLLGHRGKQDVAAGRGRAEQAVKKNAIAAYGVFQGKKALAGLGYRVGTR